jgi:hypothetical protein
MNATQNLFYYYSKLAIIYYLHYSNFVISKFGCYIKGAKFLFIYLFGQYTPN